MVRKQAIFRITRLLTRELQYSVNLTMKKIRIDICFFERIVMPSTMFQEMYLSSKRSVRVCVEGKRINRGVGHGLEIPAQYIFHGNEKAIQWAKRTLDAINGSVKKKVLRC